MESMIQLEEWAQDVRKRWNRRLDKLESVLKEEMKKTKHSENGQEESN